MDFDLDDLLLGADVAPGSALLNQAPKKKLDEDTQK